MRGESTTAAPARVGPWPREACAFLELLALTGVAVAQPTLDILSKDSGSFFIPRDVSPFQAVLFALLVVLVPPLVLWSVEVLVGLAIPWARPWVHAVLAGAVVGVLALEVLKQQTPLTPSRLFAGAALLAAVGAVLVLRSALVRQFLRYLALAPAVFVVLFLFFSPVTTVVFGDKPAAAERVTVGKPSRVVMIMFDEFPLESLLDGTGRVDATLFPNFAELAAGSTWYRNHTSVAPFTAAAVPAVLTGRYPTATDTPPVAADHPHNLFTLLGGTYRLNVHETDTRLCPTTMCADVGRAPSAVHAGFGGLVRDAWKQWRTFSLPESPDDDRPFTGFVDTHALDAGDRFVDGLHPSSRPQLDYLHVLLPHQPWHYLPDGRDYRAGLVRGGVGYDDYWNGWVGKWANESVVLAGRERHLLQVQTVDRLLGHAVRRLRRIGAYDDALVVVTADHGMAFTAGSSMRGATAANYSEIMWTPLFVKAPGRRAETIDDRPARAVDVVPTIADHLDTRIPWRTDGRSLLGAPGPDGPRRLLDYEYNELEPAADGLFVNVDGPAGFARALAGRASAATGDPDMRLYRVGVWGGLVGRRAKDLVVRGGPGIPGNFFGAEVFAAVDTSAPVAPWTYALGTLAVEQAGRPLAITVNGRIAAFSETFGEPKRGRTQFWAVLPPQMFRDGRNDVRLYVVDGTPAAPRLTPVHPG